MQKRNRPILQATVNPLTVKYLDEMCEAYNKLDVWKELGIKVTPGRLIDEFVNTKYQLFKEKTNVRSKSKGSKRS